MPQRGQARRRGAVAIGAREGDEFVTSFMVNSADFFMSGSSHRADLRVAGAIAGLRASKV